MTPLSAAPKTMRLQIASFAACSVMSAMQRMTSSLLASYFGKD